MFVYAGTLSKEPLLFIGRFAVGDGCRICILPIFISNTLSFSFSHTHSLSFSNFLLLSLYFSLSLSLSLLDSSKCFMLTGVFSQFCKFFLILCVFYRLSVARKLSVFQNVLQLIIFETNSEKKFCSHILLSIRDSI